MSLNTLPESATELKEWFEGKDLRLSILKISKGSLLSDRLWNKESNLQGSIKPFTNSQNLMFAINLDELSHYLKIDKILLIKMIQIFDELDFVTIDNGVMTVNQRS